MIEKVSSKTGLKMERKKVISKRTSSCKIKQTKSLAFLSTFVLIFSLFGISRGEQRTCPVATIRNGGENVISDDIFDQYEPFDEYNSTLTANSAGLEGIYSITNSMINSLIPTVIPEGKITVNNGNIEIKDDDYLGLLEAYVGYLVFLSVLLVFALVVPIVGLCFCCCRCCGKCGAQVELSDKKNDHWPKVIMSSFLLIANILFLFGMVGAFGTNQKLWEGTDQLVPNVDTAIDDSLAYFVDVSNHAQHIIKNNLGAFSVKLSNTLGDTGDTLFEEIAEVTKMDFVFEAFKLTEKFDPVKKLLTELKILVDVMKAQAFQMNDGSRSIKEQLENIFDECENNCSIKPDLKSLLINIDLIAIPDVSSVITSMEDVNVGTSLNDAKDQLEAGRDDLVNTISCNVQDIQTEIDKINNEVGIESDKLVELIDDVSQKMNTASKDITELAQSYIKEYNIYLYSVGLVVSIVLLLIAVSIFIGLIFGLFGDRPVKNQSNCCSKSIGHGFLIFAVIMMFMSTTILVVLLIINNLAMFAKLLVCEPLRHPDQSSVINLINDLVNVEGLLGEDASISSILKSCSENESAYVVLNIKSKFDIHDIKQKIEELDIDGVMLEIQNKIDQDVDFEEFANQLDTDQVVDALEEIKKSNLDEINLDNFEIEELDDIDLKALTEEIDRFIETIKNVKPELALNANAVNKRIKAYIKNLIEPMKDNAKKVLDKVNEILDELNFENGFNNQIDMFITDIKKIKDNLKEMNTDSLMKIVKEFSDEILSQTNSFVEFTITTVEDDMGKCAPFYNSINSLLIATCDNVFEPMNGFWFSIFWCLCMYVPMMVLSVKLGSLYKKVRTHEETYPIIYENGSRNFNNVNNQFEQYGKVYKNPIARKSTKDYYY